MKKLSILLAFFMLVGFVVQAQQKITGTVTGAEDGLPIPGVSIYVKGNQSLGTATNIDGQYTLTVPEDAQVLVFSSVGMQDMEVAIDGRSVIDVTMQASTMEMDEVVVVAYGSKRKGSITGTVEVLDAKVLENTPVASFDQMLQGRAPGVQVTATNGRPGGSANIKIRGVGSISAGSSPLFVIDGVPVESGNFAALNPDDIESMSILKDASAASLYGSRASNGVVLVTTKKGRKGDASINYSYQFGMSDMMMTGIDMMDAREKLEYENQLGYKNRTQTEIDSLVNNYGHDWFETLTRTGYKHNHQLSVRGGTDRTNYYLSLNKLNEEGIVGASYFDRIGMRTNIDYKLKDNVTIGTNLSVGQYERGVIRDRRNVQNPFNAMFGYNPYEPERNPDGTYNSTHQGFSISEALENNPESIQQIKAVGSLFLEWDITEDLTFKTQGGIDFKEMLGEYYVQPGSILAGFVGDAKRDDWTRDYTTVFTNTLNYSKTFSEVHNFDGLVGIEYNENYNKYMRINSKGYPSAKVSTAANAAEINDGSTTRSDWSLASYFANASYNYDQTYFVDLSFRRDGSSRFGADNRYGNFWALGASWNLHRESFLKSVTVIDRLKVYGSVGTSGNFNIGNYASLGLYGFDAYNGASASRPIQIANEELTWESALSYSGGFDITMFNGRLNGSFNLYKKKTTDMLLAVPLSYTSGFSSRLENIGEMENQGIEISIDGDIVKTNDFNLNLGFSASHNKNKVTELYGGEDIVGYNTVIREGEPINSFYMVRYAGVNPANGDALYYDKDGNVTATWNGDDAVILDESPNPDWYGNFSLNASYRNFGLSSNIYYNVGNSIVNGIRFFTDSDGANVADNQSTRMFDAWKEPGDITSVPKQVAGSTNHYSTRYLEDGSFIRLRDVTLYYTVPKELTQKISVQNARFYIKGQNLWTYAPNFNGFDPEVGNPSGESSETAAFGSFYDFSFPTVRTFTVGIEVGF
ncbi:MAG: TonB-dependent receptor [Bacteroidales bacterium]